MHSCLNNIYLNLITSREKEKVTKWLSRIFLLMKAHPFLKYVTRTVNRSLMRSTGQTGAGLMTRNQIRIEQLSDECSTVTFLTTGDRDLYNTIMWIGSRSTVIKGGSYDGVYMSRLADIPNTSWVKFDFRCVDR